MTTLQKELDKLMTELEFDRRDEPARVVAGPMRPVADGARAAAAAQHASSGDLTQLECAEDDITQHNAEGALYRGLSREDLAR